MSRIAYVNGRYCRTRTRWSTSRTAATSSPTASTRCARCSAAGSSTKPATSTGWTARSASSGSRCHGRAAALRTVMRETVRRNRVRDGIVYLQVTRGVARRDHPFPAAGADAGAGRHGQRTDRRGR